MGAIMADLLLRFLVGGAFVCTFALIGDMFKPKSFGGLFGAAPSVAIATLALTVHKDGVAYAALEARSMVFGAGALLVYSQVVCWWLMRGRVTALKSALVVMPLWFFIAFGSRFWLLR
jgi:hypothetical protein